MLTEERESTAMSDRQMARRSSPMSHYYRLRGARRARSRRLVVTVAAIALSAAAGSAIAACASPSAPSASSVADAYRLAHPTEGLPGTLRTVAMSPTAVRRRIAGIVRADTRIVLPASLPPGFAPAEPYIAVGDGTVRPNPEGWGTSYRVSYTDGRGLLVMTVGAEALPDGVEWNDERLRVDGRPARVGRAGSAVVVATSGSDPLIVVTGRRVRPAEVMESAESIAALR
jgi:hypothetical protein